jgi:hypothetical protein
MSGSEAICPMLISFWYISFKGNGNGVAIPGLFGV